MIGHARSVCGLRHIDERKGSTIYKWQEVTENLEKVFQTYAEFRSGKLIEFTTLDSYTIRVRRESKKMRSEYVAS